ncbi:hypothetical protein BKA69DRAFT_1127628 [Paraphysoderma sedebokerense]|nr:hypothetical protein BKA69DRAFT_1127628 [Paraphysoderma sedebokerense]
MISPFSISPKSSSISLSTPFSRTLSLTDYGTNSFQILVRVISLFSICLCLISIVELGTETCVLIRERSFSCLCSQASFYALNPSKSNNNNTRSSLNIDRNLVRCIPQSDKPNLNISDTLNFPNPISAKFNATLANIKSTITNLQSIKLSECIDNKGDQVPNPVIPEESCPTNEDMPQLKHQRLPLPANADLRKWYIENSQIIWGEQLSESFMASDEPLENISKWKDFIQIIRLHFSNDTVREEIAEILKYLIQEYSNNSLPLKQLIEVLVDVFAECRKFELIGLLQLALSSSAAQTYLVECTEYKRHSDWGILNEFNSTKSSVAEIAKTLDPGLNSAGSAPRELSVKDGLPLWSDVRALTFILGSPKYNVDLKLNAMLELKLLLVPKSRAKVGCFECTTSATLEADKTKSTMQPQSKHNSNPVIPAAYESNVNQFELNSPSSDSTEQNDRGVLIQTYGDNSPDYKNLSHENEPGSQQNDDYIKNLDLFHSLNGLELMEVLAKQDEELRMSGILLLQSINEVLIKELGIV